MSLAGRLIRHNGDKSAPRLRMCATEPVVHRRRIRWPDLPVGAHDGRACEHRVHGPFHSSQPAQRISAPSA